MILILILDKIFPHNNYGLMFYGLFLCLAYGIVKIELKYILGPHDDNNNLT